MEEEGVSGFDGVQVCLRLAFHAFAKLHTYFLFSNVLLVIAKEIVKHRNRNASEFSKLKIAKMLCSENLKLHSIFHFWCTELHWHFW